MSDNKWDDKLTEKFLTLYKKHKCLWNPYSPDYKNCFAKNEAFEIVVRELNVPGIRLANCLQQIEVIRERYREEQARVKRELKSGKLYSSKLPWFDLMSQMLCEVIRDEENFDKNCEFSSEVPNCFRTDKGKRHEDDAGTNKRAHGGVRPLCLKNKSEKSVVIGSRYEINNSRYDESVISKEDVENSAGLKKRTAENDEVDCNRCDKCSSSGCSWENEGREEEEEEDDEKEKAYGEKKIRFVNCEEIGVQIEPEMSDRSNRKRIRTTMELADVKGSGKGERDPAEGKENEIMGNCVASGLKRNDKIETVKNSKILQPYNQDTLSWEKDSAKLPEELGGESMESRTNKNCCYDSCMKHLSRDSVPKFSPEYEQGRYVSSRFKIVIPGPASEDQNLEITRYEVCTMDPRLRFNANKPQLKENFDGKRIDSSDSYCVCSRKELSLNSRRSGCNAQDAAGFDGNIIKLNINCNNSEDVQRRRSTDEYRVNKKTQTKRLSFGNEWMRSREETEFSSPAVSVRDQESGTDDSSWISRVTRYSADASKDVGAFVASRDKSEATENASCCTEQEEDPAEMSSLLVSDEGRRFSNTKMVLNVIVKILEGDDTEGEISSAELERTLNTMLETFNRKISIGGSISGAVEVPRNEISRKHAPLISAFETTQYTDLLPKLQRRNRESADTSRNTKSTNSRPQSAGAVLNNRSNEIPGEDETLMFFLPGERNDAANEGAARFDGVASGQSQTPNVLMNESREESADDEEIIIVKSGPRVAAAPEEGMRMPRFSSDPTLNYTFSEFESEEPVASSSRKTIEESRPRANQLAKDFLDVIRYTIMMDRVLENSGNNGNDCCNKLPNQSANSQNPHKRRD